MSIRHHVMLEEVEQAGKVETTACSSAVQEQGEKWKVNCCSIGRWENGVLENTTPFTEDLHVEVSFHGCSSIMGREVFEEWHRKK